MTNTITRPHLWGSYNNGIWIYINTATEDRPKDVLLRERRSKYWNGWKYRWSNNTTPYAVVRADGTLGVEEE